MFTLDHWDTHFSSTHPTGFIFDTYYSAFLALNRLHTIDYDRWRHYVVVHLSHYESKQP